MTETDLAPGDVVYLKSGSPPMTLARFDEGRAICAWFTGRETASQAYAPTVLTRSKPSQELLRQCLPVGVYGAWSGV